MDNKDEMKLRKYVDERNSYDKEQSRDNGKQHLREALHKHMTTLMIGAISEFENHFGDDWGHGLTDKQRTDVQLDDKAVWNRCRERIMDLGNHLINKLEKEMKKYEVAVKKYHYSYSTEDIDLKGK